MDSEQQDREHAFDLGVRWGVFRTSLLERLETEQVSVATFDAVLNLLDEFPTDAGRQAAVETVLDSWENALAAEHGKS